MGQAATSVEEGATALLLTAAAVLLDAAALLPESSLCRLRGKSSICGSAASRSVGDTGAGALDALLLRSCLLLLIPATSFTVGWDAFTRRLWPVL